MPFRAPTTTFWRIAAENNETVRELLAEIDKDHVYLDGEDCNDYLSDMMWLQL